MSLHAIRFTDKETGKRLRLVPKEQGRDQYGRQEPIHFCGSGVTGDKPDFCVYVKEMCSSGKWDYCNGNKHYFKEVE